MKTIAGIDVDSIIGIFVVECEQTFKIRFLCYDDVYDFAEYATLEKVERYFYDLFIKLKYTHDDLRMRACSDGRIKYVAIR